MGISDKIIFDVYSDYIKKLNLPIEEIKRVAWLGQQKSKVIESDTNHMFFKIKNQLSDNCEHHFYDIENSNTEDQFSWEHNKDWNIEGYDLVLYFRTGYLARSKKQIVEQLKLTAQKNKFFISDFHFSHAPLIDEQKKEVVFTWEKTKQKNNMVWFLIDFLDKREGWSYKYRSLTEDNAVNCEDLTKNNIELANVYMFNPRKMEPTLPASKSRFVILAKVEVH